MSHQTTQFSANSDDLSPVTGNQLDVDSKSLVDSVTRTAPILFPFPAHLIVNIPIHTLSRRPQTPWTPQNSTRTFNKPQLAFTNTQRLFRLTKDRFPVTATNLPISNLRYTEFLRWTFLGHRTRQNWPVHWPKDERKRFETMRIFDEALPEE